MTTIIRYVRIGLVCLLAVNLWSAAAVAEADVAGYPLPQAWQDALERDARLRAAASRIAQARGRVGEVASERWPSLSATGQLGHVYNRNEARRAVVYEGRSLRGTLYLSQPLYTFGRLTGRTARADADLAEAEAAAVEVRHTVLAEVTQRFAETVWQGRMFALQETFEELTATLEASTRERLALNAGDRTEVHELARRRHRATAARLEAGARYRTARTRLARLTGTDHADVAGESLEFLLAALPPSLAATLAKAVRQSPVLAQARAQWEMIASLALAVQDFGQAVEEARTAATLIRDKLAAGRATVVDEVDACQAVLRAEHDVLDGRLRLAGARIDLLRLLAALEPDG